MEIYWQWWSWRKQTDEKERERTGDSDGPRHTRTVHSRIVAKSEGRDTVSRREVGYGAVVVATAAAAAAVLVPVG